MWLDMLEHKSQPPLSAREFAHRMARQGGWAVSLVLMSLAIGMAGYRWAAHYSWIDSFLNAAMLLGGMGPVGELPSPGAKAFAGIFALYSGLVFLIIAGMLLVPVFHRVLHKFHWEQRDSR